MQKILLPLSALLMSDAVVLMGNGLHGVLIPVRAQQEGFPEFSIGLLISLFYAGILLGCLLCPYAIRRAGHIRAFTAMTAIAVAAPLLHAIFPVPEIWMALRLLTGICFAGLTMGIESWLNDIATPQSRGRILSLYTMVNLFAITVGQLMLNLADPSGFELFSLVAILTSLAAVPLALTRVVAPEPPQIVRLEMGRLFTLSPVGVAGCAMAGFVSGAFWGLAPLTVLSMGLPVSSVALFMSAAVLGGALAQWPLGWLSDRNDRRLVLILSCAISGAGGLALTVMDASGLALIALAALFGAGMLPLYALSLAHANDFIAREESVRVNSGLLLVFAGGAVAGPLLASLLIDEFGGRALYAFTAVSLAALVLFILLRLGQRPSAAPEKTRGTFVTYPSTSQAVYRLFPRVRQNPPGSSG